MMKKLLLMIAVLILVVAACGGGEDAATGDLPVNTGDEPGTALDSTCLAGEPDCQDIPGNEVPQDLPAGDDVVADDGMVVEGDLTVAEALGTDATGVIAVRGFVVATGDEARLCDALAESFPPQCGGDSVQIDSLDSIDPDELKSEGDTQWTDTVQTVFGELIDGVLVTSALSQ